MASLEIKDLSVSYGEVQVLRNVSLYVEEQELVGVVGPNGSGKTTLLRAISHLIESDQGSIIFEGKNITQVPSHDIAKMGVIHIPEGRQLFPGMTVYDNLMLGGYCIDKKARQKLLQEVYELFPRIQERKNQIAGTLSGGEQQMVAIARALMAKPRLLMLDEPSLGLAPIMVEETFEAVKRINSNGTTILLIEQNVFECLDLTSRAYVLENGEIVQSGKSSELLNTERIQQAYLGI